MSRCDLTRAFRFGGRAVFSYICKSFVNDPGDEMSRRAGRDQSRARIRVAQPLYLLVATRTCLFSIGKRILDLDKTTSASI